MKTPECNITRDLMPGISVTIALTPYEIDCAYRAKELIYRQEDAAEHIRRKIDEVTDDRADMDAFTKRYGMPAESVENNDEFIATCAEMFAGRATSGISRSATWADIIDTQLEL